MVPSRHSGHWHARIYLTMLSGALLIAGSQAAGAVYRCVSGDEPPRFSQFPCGDGRVVVLEPVHTVRIPPVSDEERALLDELERERRAERAERAARRARARAQTRAEREAREQRCATARSELDALAAQRRKGYRASEARALDRREAALEAEARQSC